MGKLQGFFKEKIIKVSYNVIENNIDEFYIFKVRLDHWKNKNTAHKKDEYLNLAFKQSGIQDHAILLYEQCQNTFIVFERSYPKNIAAVDELLIDIIYDILKPRTTMHMNDLMDEIKESFLNFKYYQKHINH